MLSLTAVRQAGDEGDARATEAIVYPTLGTLLATGAVASLVCRTPDTPFASWGALLARAAGYVLLAGVAHTAAVWAICRIYGDRRQATAQTVMRGSWICAALLPLAVVLAHTGSAWAAAVLPAIAVAAVLFVRRAVPEAGRRASLPAPDAVATGLFAYAAPAPLLRTLWPAAAVALMAEMAAAMLASWQYALAGLLLGLCTAVVLWRTPLPARAVTNEASARGVKAPTAVALLLTIAALLPSLGGSRMAGMIGRFVGGPPALAKAPPPPSPVHAGHARGGALSGVILTLPPKPRQRLLLPSPPSATPAIGATRQVQTIPFDGAYWYFRSLELRPGEDAKRVRGDPTKVEIRSTDASALQMEAHQRLDTPIPTDCCSAIRVRVRNAETREGAIRLQLVLEASAAKDGWRRELETVALPSSLLPASARREGGETLTFAVPRNLPRSPIDALTVVVLLPAGETSRRGAHLAIESFELVGR